MIIDEQDLIIDEQDDVVGTEPGIPVRKATNAAIRDEVQNLMADWNPSRRLSRKVIRERLEDRFGVPLVAKKQYIKETVDTILQEKAAEVETQYTTTVNVLLKRMTDQDDLLREMEKSMEVLSAGILDAVSRVN